MFRDRKIAPNFRGGDTLGNPHRDQISRFELFELILLLRLDKQFPVERFEAAASQSTVPFPLLRLYYIILYDTILSIHIYIYIYNTLANHQIDELNEDGAYYRLGLNFREWY